jgi:hypothetical protein
VFLGKVHLTSSDPPYVILQVTRLREKLYSAILFQVCDLFWNCNAYEVHEYLFSFNKVLYFGVIFNIGYILFR